MNLKSFASMIAPSSLSLLLLIGITAPLLPIWIPVESAVAQTPAQRKKVAIVDFDFANTSDPSYW